MVGRVLIHPRDALAALFEPASRVVRDHRQAHAQFVLPATVLAEVLVGAARRGRDELETRRNQAVAAFGAPASIDEEVAVAAAQLRAMHRSLRLPDALVLATAAAVEADTVLTGDEQWLRIDSREQMISSTAAMD